MKRILIILGTLILSGCSLLGQPTEAPAIEAAAPEPAQPTAAPAIEVAASEPAILSEIENDVAVHAKNEVDWKKVATVELVGDGGSVRTQTDSRARLDLPNGNVLWIGPDTIFELSNFNDHAWVIFLNQGVVLLEVTADNLGRSGIITPMGIAWPTGSLLGVNHNPTTETMDVGCFEGSCMLAVDGFMLSVYNTQSSQYNHTAINPHKYLNGSQDFSDFGDNDDELLQKPVPAHSHIIMRKSVINEWAAIEPEGMVDDYFTQWVLNFPTKHFYPDMPTSSITPEDPDNGGEAPTTSQTTQCDLFKGAEFSHVYGPWLPGAPLPVNIKMPANVAWQELDYNLKIGGVETEACAPLEGNNTRLSCKIKLLSEYAGTYNQYALALHLDGCGEPIYSVGTLSLPVPEPNDTSEKPKDKEETNSCDPYAHDQIACESGGGIWDLVFSSCTCP